jgi:hypothetical protein
MQDVFRPPTLGYNANLYDINSPQSAVTLSPVPALDRQPADAAAHAAAVSALADELTARAVDQPLSADIRAAAKAAKDAAQGERIQAFFREVYSRQTFRGAPPTYTRKSYLRARHGIPTDRPVPKYLLDRPDDEDDEDTPSRAYDDKSLPSWVLNDAEVVETKAEDVDNLLEFKEDNPSGPVVVDLTHLSITPHRPVRYGSPSMPPHSSDENSQDSNSLGIHRLSTDSVVSPAVTANSLISESLAIALLSAPMVLHESEHETDSEAESAPDFIQGPANPAPVVDVPMDVPDSPPTPNQH